MTTYHWQIWPSPQGSHHQLMDSDQHPLKDALEACAAKAIELLEKNIQDDSLYLLFEWNPETCALNIVVTDADKQRDAPASVGARFAQSANTDLSTAQVRFLLSDYLASCGAFMRYSLVAIFHSEARANSTLL